jgi:hypothetical protein
MRTRLALFAAVSFAAAIAACHSSATPPPAAAVTTSATTSKEARKKAFEAAAAQLSHDVKAPRDSIVGVSQEEVTWPDAWAKTAEHCAQVLTPGYKIVLGVGDARYEYHTNLGGTARLCGQSPPPGAPPPSGVAVPPPAPTPSRRG